MEGRPCLRETSASPTTSYFVVATEIDFRSVSRFCHPFTRDLDNKSIPSGGGGARDEDGVCVFFLHRRGNFHI